MKNKMTGSPLETTAEILESMDREHRRLREKYESLDNAITYAEEIGEKIAAPHPKRGNQIDDR